MSGVGCVHWVIKEHSPEKGWVVLSRGYQCSNDWEAVVGKVLASNVNEKLFEVLNHTSAYSFQRGGFIVDVRCVFDVPFDNDYIRAVFFVYTPCSVCGERDLEYFERLKDIPPLQSIDSLLERAVEVYLDMLESDRLYFSGEAYKQEFVAFGFLASRVMDSFQSLIVKLMKARCEELRNYRKIVERRPEAIEKLERAWLLP